MVDVLVAIVAISVYVVVALFNGRDDAKSTAEDIKKIIRKDAK